MTHPIFIFQERKPARRPAIFIFSRMRARQASRHFYFFKNASLPGVPSFLFFQERKPARRPAIFIFSRTRARQASRHFYFFKNASPPGVPPFLFFQERKPARRPAGFEIRSKGACLSFLVGDYKSPGTPSGFLAFRVSAFQRFSKKEACPPPAPVPGDSIACPQQSAAFIYHFLFLYPLPAFSDNNP